MFVKNKQAIELSRQLLVLHTCYEVEQQYEVLMGSKIFKFISWREAHSSTGDLVTGGGAAVPKTKLSITQSFFKLEAQNFAW